MAQTPSILTIRLDCCNGGFAEYVYFISVSLQKINILAGSILFIDTRNTAMLVEFIN